MTDIGKTFDRAVFDILARELIRCRDGRFTGALHLIGSPGGVFHLRQGTVVGVDSPGAPGADALLLRSGRVSEAEWTAALCAGAESRSYEAQLVANGHLGRTALEVVCLMAAQDAAFAAAAGTVEGHRADPGPTDVLLPMAQGVDGESLLRETARRLHALASLPTPVSPHRERVAPAGGSEQSARPLAPVREEILDHANGRRSARDIAFLTGRGVFPVTVEISRMLSEGLVELVSGGSPSASPVQGAVTPRRREEGADAGADHIPAQFLPRRDPGASGINETLAPPRAASGWQGLPRLLNRIWAAQPAAPTSQEPGGSWEQKGNSRES